MKSYLISVISIAIILATINLILPNGRLSKYTKSICSFILALCIIYPVLNFNMSENFNLFEKSDIEIPLQEDYINYVFTSKKDSDEKNIQRILDNIGINYLSIQIEYSVIDKTDFTPKKIKILLIKNGNEKEKIDTAKEKICDIFNLKKEKVIFNEQ